MTVAGDVMLASATGAATQVGTALSETVMGRLLVGSDSSQAAMDLREAPGDPQHRAEATAALRAHLNRDPEFADELARRLSQAEKHVRVETHGQGNTTTVGSTVTAHGRGTANTGIINNIRKTKKGGVFWGLIAAVVIVLSTGTTVLVTGSGPEDSPEEQAEKVAVDFLKAAYGGDVDVACGLVSQKTVDGLGDEYACGDEQNMAEARNKPASEAERDMAAQWKSESVELPSDSSARVIATNNGRDARVLLVREEGGWKVSRLEGGQA